MSETVVDDRMLVRVTGEGQCDLKSVWIVVHPIKGDEFWVQPKPTQRGNEWTAYVRVGRSDSDWTEVFELRAFGNPVGGLGAGKLVTDWPKAAVESDPITVKRKPFPVSMPVPGPSSENSGGRREARCPEPFEIGAVRMPGANRAQVTLSPAIPGFEYEVHITAPNGQSYVERLSGGVGVVRLGDAANTGTFILQGSARGIGTCTTQYSKPVSITLE